MAADSSHGYRLDLVLEGGGVKGIGLAGAYSVLEEHGYEPQNVAGTSAGAITAALIAARYSAAELKEIVLSLDFKQFEDKAWEDRLPVVDRSASILLDQGIYEGKRFYEWIKGLLAQKGVYTFADLVDEEFADDPRHRSRLQVIASDVMSRRLLVELPGVALRLRDRRGARVADVRPAARRAGSQDADLATNSAGEAGLGSGADDRVHQEHGAHDDGGARPDLSREGGIRAHDSHPDPRDRHNRLRTFA
jgi:hypothetical protein